MTGRIARAALQGRLLSGQTMNDFITHQGVKAQNGKGITTDIEYAPVGAKLWPYKKYPDRVRSLKAMICL